MPFLKIINVFVSLRRQTYSCVTCFSKFLSLSWTVAETPFIYIYMYILCNCPLSFIEIQCDGFPAGIHLCRTSGLKCAFVLLTLSGFYWPHLKADHDWNNEQEFISTFCTLFFFTSLRESTKLVRYGLSFARPVWQLYLSPWLRL